MCDGKLFVGLALYRETAEYLYIEHFYILQALRNHRYGQRTLDLLAECGKTLILEIDPSMDAIVCLRKMFYERCGFARILSHIYTRPTTLKIAVMPLSL